jgi:3-keto steroid reductase
LGSPHQTITPYKAAISATYVSFISLCYLTFSSARLATPSGEGLRGSTRGESDVGPLKYDAETDRWGLERVGVSEVKRWREYETEGEELLQKCDNLYRSMRDPRNGTIIDPETASERM